MNIRNRPGVTLPMLGFLLIAGLASSALAASVQALPSTYSAVITDWPQGKTGTVTLEGDLASGKVDVRGRFTITLPVLAGNQALRDQLAPLATLFTSQPNLNDAGGQPCKGEGKAMPTTALGNEFSLFASVDGAAPVRLNLYSDASSDPPSTSGSLQFFETPTTLDGVVTCKTLTEAYKGMFPAGWSLNAHPSPIIDPATGFTSEKVIDQPTASATWHLYDAITRVGLQFAPDGTSTAGLKITGLTAGGAAEQAGVQINDLLVTVDGKSVAGLNANQVILQLRGKPGTVVTLGVMRGSETTIRSLAVTRVLVQSK